MRAATTFLFGIAGFLFGALLGRLGCELYAEMQHFDYAFTTYVAITVATSGAIMAALTLLMRKYVIIIITSYVGATFLVAGVEFLGHRQPWSQVGVTLAAIIWQVLLVTQFISDKRPEMHYRDE
jgi:hypothetical protein